VKIGLGPGLARRRAAGILAAVLVLVTAGCATTPPDQDPVQLKLKDLDERLGRLERVVANQNLLDLSNQIEALRADVRSMHNDIDVANHNLDSSRKQQHDLYADLDQRLKLVEGRGAVAASAAAPPATDGAVGGTSAPGGEAPGSAAEGAPPGGAATGGTLAAGASAGGATPADGADKISYQAAFDLLKDGQYDRAIVAFEGFLVKFPTSPLVDNGQYWLGEAFYVNKNFAEALASFRHVVDNFPASRKVPDALLKIGYCDYELKQFPAARSALAEVTTKFPDAPAAQLARQRLEKMALEGH
jgi:tol-pal system protein YbgF